MKFATKALSLGAHDAHGAMRFPIYQSAAFEAKDAAALEAVFKGQSANHAYTRSTNPTIQEFEARVRGLSGAFGVVATASGMGAISNVLLGLLKTGDNFIATNHLFGNTISLFNTLFEDMGIEVRYVEHASEVEAHIDANTRLFFCEALSNPQLSIVDFATLKPVLKAHNIPLVVDTTMTPWNIFDAKAQGVDVEVVSATKFISGGGHVLGGLVLEYGTFDWGKAPNLASFYAKFGPNAFIAKLRKETYRNLGACLTPQSAYLLALGLETLDLRVKRSCESALTLAQTLEKKGLKVHYPLLESSPYCGLATKTFSQGGALLSLDMGSKETAYALMDSFKIFKRGTNIQDNKSLAIAPYHTIYAEFSHDQKVAWGVSEGLIRLSIGLEDPEDLETDFTEIL
ncbi:MAG: O-acetylhomoserine aminocarboxypropyltransferase/cysteine synthase [Campylobacterales bacterium]|nr:O-acetylhomoserine aminocarboxypropyltransferase/cysteine synthase [Campylobacterales bacterium]